MYKIPEITPLENLILSTKIFSDIVSYKKKNWAIGQLYPSGGADYFTYFFTIRNIPIASYLRGTISIGDPSAYDENIANIKFYINKMINVEVEKCEAVIDKILEYKAKNWAIGEKYPDSGPDFFVDFFGRRNLIVSPYLVGTVTIGTPAAYDENIKILCSYIEVIRSFRIVG